MVDSSVQENQDIVYALAASPDFAQDGICFAARHSGLWRSNDGGMRWQAIHNIPFAPDNFVASAVAVSPNFQTDGTVFVGVPGSILCSRDSGVTWTVVTLPAPAPFIATLALSPDFEQDRTAFAATLEDGIFRTVDGGVSWQAWNFGLFDLGVLCIAVSAAYTQDKTVYIGTETGIFLSKNGGRAWQESDFPPDFAPVLSLALSPKFVDDGILFAGTETSGLWYSDNRGKSWQQVLDTDAVNAIWFASDFSKTADICAVSNQNVWHSSDGGQFWSPKIPAGTFDATITSATVSGSLTQNAVIFVGLSNEKIVRLPA
jgi:photosystem II stability/assembly factor-like uncharacterized protein